VSSSKDEHTWQETPWIEKLLRTPVEDYRKRVRDLVLVPYLVVRRGITDEAQVSAIVMGWADKCAELRGLEPSRREFESRVRTRTHEVMQSRIPPMRLATFQEMVNPDLYETIKLGERGRGGIN
jgi:hypothetical protein